MDTKVSVLFLRSTGLGSVVAEVDEVHQVASHLANQFIYSGRAILAPVVEQIEPVTVEEPVAEVVTPTPAPKKGK